MQSEEWAEWDDQQGNAIRGVIFGLFIELAGVLSFLGVLATGFWLLR